MAADRRQRRAQLVRDRHEEVALALLGLGEPGRHVAEPLGEVADLVAAARLRDLDRVVAGGDLVGGPREREHGPVDRRDSHQASTPASSDADREREREPHEQRDAIVAQVVFRRRDDDRAERPSRGSSRPARRRRGSAAARPAARTRTSRCRSPASSASPSAVTRQRREPESSPGKERRAGVEERSPVARSSFSAAKAAPARPRRVDAERRLARTAGRGRMPRASARSASGRGSKSWKSRIAIAVVTRPKSTIPARKSSRQPEAERPEHAARVSARRVAGAALRRARPCSRRPRRSRSARRRRACGGAGARGRRPCACRRRTCSPRRARAAGRA